MQVSVLQVLARQASNCAPWRSWPYGAYVNKCHAHVIVFKSYEFGVLACYHETVVL